MPSKRLNASAATVYLDQSTLSDCFRSTFLEERLRSERPYVDLLVWVERVSKEANLCISHPHVIETSRWKHGVGMARWLDTLDLVWLRSYPEVQRDEDEHLVRVIAGVEDAETPSPFAPSFLSAFGELTAETVASMLASATIEAAVIELQERKDEPERRFMSDFLVALGDDRSFIEEHQVSAEEVRAKLEYNKRVALRRRAAEAHERLVARGERAYVATGASWGSVQDPFVERYETDPTVLPTTRTLGAYSAGLARETSKLDPRSHRTQRRLASGFYDLAHAAAAAYCDVFTCDEFTSRCLGGVRERWGLKPPLAKLGDEDASRFVRRVVDTRCDP